jgi:dethiobiotin synthetase
MNYFVTAIGTDSGKTLVSAILVEAWGADYWKPVQAGRPTDTDTIRELTGDRYTCHPEAFLLQKPASPHDAAKEEGIIIRCEDIEIPKSQNENLVIEGTGGLMVPLNEKESMVDMIHKFQARVVLVADIYLGSINHTMLTIAKLMEEKLPVEGIIFNGPENSGSESYIMKHCPWPCMFKLRRLKKITSETVVSLAEELNSYGQTG